MRLVDFRSTHYPPVAYLHSMGHGQEPARTRVEMGLALDVPGTGRRLTPVEFFPRDEDGVVEIGLSDGTRMSVPAEVGSSHEIRRVDLSLRILRYEPSFKIDFKTREITSDTTEPVNPALQVALVREGVEQRPRWLFARNPDFGHPGRHATQGQVRLRFLDPSCPVLVADADTPSGKQRLRLEKGKRMPSPWDPGLHLVYERRAGRVKEYESEVEVLEGGQVVRCHVIRVNDPLVHKGTKLSQVSYDEKNLRYTVLGVSRDSGVWFVYAGFVALTLGLMGKFYLNPFLCGIRKGQATEEG